MLLFVVIAIAVSVYIMFGHMIWSRIVWERIRRENGTPGFKPIYQCATKRRLFFAFLWVSFVSVWPAWMVVGFIRAKWQDHLDHVAAHA